MFYGLFPPSSPHPPLQPLTDDGVQTLRGEVRFSEWRPATTLIPLYKEPASLPAAATSERIRVGERTSFEGENVPRCVCVYDCECVQMNTYMSLFWAYMCMDVYTLTFERTCVHGGVMNAHLSHTPPPPHQLLSLQNAKSPHINSFCDCSNSPQ